MTNIVDKRFTPKDGSIVNRQKFIDKYKSKIKDAIKGIVNKGSVKDFDFKGKKIKIKTGGDPVDLPGFEYDPEAGVWEGVSTGNKTFKKGDLINKPPKGNGGAGGSNGSGSDDEFEFSLTEEEFSTLFFEDLELPFLVKKRFTGDNYEIQRCGYSNTGGPSSLNMRQTMLRAITRILTLKKKYEDEGGEVNLKDGQIIIKKKKRYALEESDLKYNYRDKVSLPSSRAVMFCLMDVSGSMGEKEKDIAKRFYLLLSMFLKRNYDIVEIVFVRHAEWAEECDEQKFFHDRASGGTVISTGYEKVLEIINARYNPELWNIYISQATDGDNFNYDNEHMSSLLTKHLLGLVQYFAYIEVVPSYRRVRSNVFELLEKISNSHKNLVVKAIADYKEIFDVFRSLFLKENK